MIPDAIPATPANPPEARSTAGMTTKVVKGSIWTLAGSVLPLAVAFFLTPFVIRLLGSEAYGVLLLVGLIPTYFSFADFGMNFASTKFGAEAYANDDGERERSVVWSSFLIAFLFSVILLSPLLIAPDQVISIFNVPDEFKEVAGAALLVSAVSFIIVLLSTVLASPQLARMRFDLNVIATTVPKVLMALATPLILYLGGGIAEVVWLGFAAAIAAFVLNVFFSSKLRSGLLKMQIDPKLIRPLLRFGGGWFIASIAMTLLANFEKLVIAKLVSTQALAYYSVAFTVAGMITLFSIAIRQTLLPAFAQLSGPEKHGEFELLVKRGIRIILIVLVPGITVFCVIARPFFTLWAGEDFGRESTLPFYILAFGLFFSVLAYLPHSAIISLGRTDVFARLYWVELVAYVFVSTAFIYSFGIIGAAAAWTLRVIADSLIIIFMAKRITNVSFGILTHYKFLGGTFLIMSPLAAVAIYNNYSPILTVLVPVCLAIYAIYAWRTLVDEAEKSWIRLRVSFLFR